MHWEACVRLEVKKKPEIRKLWLMCDTRDLPMGLKVSLYLYIIGTHVTGEGLKWAAKIMMM